MMKKLFEKIDDAYWACHRFIRDYMFQPVWYRFFGHKFHIVKTKLTPSPWYDADIRILYSVMEIVKWFVENDMREWTKEEVEEEVARIKKEDLDSSEGQIECIENQYKEQEEIKSIVTWWKNYDNRKKEISEALNEWCNYRMEIAKRVYDEEYHVCHFFSAKERFTEEEDKKEEEISNKMDKLEKDLHNEEQEMLKKAIDLREGMWS